MSLRDYQLAAADAIEREWTKHASTLAVLPTGCGKTVLFAEVIRRRQPGRALVIAHREELILQARDKIEQFAGLDCEVEMADQVATTSLFHRTPVICASVQTLISGQQRRRMERFDPKDFSLIVVDEAHHIAAASYIGVWNHFRQNPEARLLGVTATPDRADKEALGQVFHSVAYNYEIVQAISDGWLVPIDQQMVSIQGLDFSGIKTTAGDLSNAELSAVMEEEENLHGLCSATIDIVGSRQAIVFTTSVKHAEMVCNILNRHRPNIADWVCGATDKETRRKRMQNVRDGTTRILVNVGVATEGFDAPGVEVIVMGRPTKSRALYTQMCGRGTRPLPGVVDGPETAEARRSAIAQSAKPSCLIVDFVGNSGRHKLVTAMDILDGNYPEEVKELADQKMREAGRAVSVSECLEQAEEELRERERLAAERAARLRELERQRVEEEKRRKHLIVKAAFQTKAVDPFDVFDIDPVLARCIRPGKSLSVKQRALLAKQGINPDSVTYLEGAQLIKEIIARFQQGLCSFKQAAMLRNRFGIDASRLSREQASQTIDRIARNRWRLPADLVHLAMAEGEAP